MPTLRLPLELLLLLEYGADLKARDLSGDTPVYSAAERGRTDIVRLLLERWPAGLLVRNNAGYTPLHSAACTGKVDVVRFLLEIWPEGKKSTTKRGRTPLMVFMDYSRDEKVDAATMEAMVALLA
jgi:ankyrin repeat protein